MTINIFFDVAISKTGHFLSHKIVPEDGPHLQHDKYLLHRANFVPGAMGQNRSEYILSHYSECFLLHWRKKNQLFFLRAHAMEHVA